MSESRAPHGRDRWRTGMLVALVTLQGFIGWQQIPAGYGEIAAWLADPEQQRMTNPFWLHLTTVSVTLANVLLFAGAGAALLARGAASRRWLLGSFAVYLALMVGSRLPPTAWSYDFPPELAADGAKIIAGSAPLMAAAGCIDLLPLLLAVTFGLARGGHRQARRGANRALGVTILVAASLQLCLLAAVGLAFVQPLLPATRAPLGLLLVTAHFALTAIGWFLLLKQRPHGERALRTVLAGSSLVLLLPGLALVLVDLYRAELFGMHIVAFGEQAGLVPVDELPIVGALFAARSIATAVAASDLIARSEATRM